MKAIIDVFQMENISDDTKINILVKLGKAINHEHAMNITEELVCELINEINPDHEQTIHLRENGYFKCI